MNISVCIATWSRKNKLQEIIELLENQSMPREEYEIIVVDSCSPDGTDDLMSCLCAKFNNIKYIKDAANVLAVKRNVGIENSSSDIIVFMDDDVYPSNTFIESHFRANMDNKDTFYCGQIRFPEELCELSNYYFFRDSQHLKKKDSSKDLPFNNIVVMNLSFRKSFIGKTGKVDERFLGYGCEDIEFGYRVVKAGFKLRYLDEALAIHKEDSSDIVSYGKKLYKSGLYGDRVLKRICPEAEKAINKGKKLIGFLLSLKPIYKLIEKGLTRNDSNRKKYSYKLFKAYLYSCIYRGKRDQKKFPDLDLNSISKGW